MRKKLRCTQDLALGKIIKKSLHWSLWIAKCQNPIKETWNKLLEQVIYFKLLKFISIFFRPKKLFSDGNDHWQQWHSDTMHDAPFWEVWIPCHNGSVQITGFILPLSPIRLLKFLMAFCLLCKSSCMHAVASVVSDSVQTYGL